MTSTHAHVFMQPDYARLHGHFARDLVNAPACRPAALPAKVCGYLNASLRPILLDPTLNGPAAVAATIHACAALAAVKMHCCLRSMRERGAAGRRAQHAAQRRGLRGSGSGPRSRVARGAAPRPCGSHSSGAADFSVLALRTLDTVSGYMVSTCMRAWAALPSAPVQGHATDQPADTITDSPATVACVCEAVPGGDDEGRALTAADVELLALSAFQKVLRRKHASYGGALSEIAGRQRASRLRRRHAVWEQIIAPSSQLPAELRGIEW